MRSLFLTIASTPSGILPFAARASIARRGRHSFVPVVFRREQHLQVIAHAGHVGNAPGGFGRLQALRVAQHRAAERYIAAHHLDGNICHVHERVVFEFGFHCLANIVVLSHLSPSFIPLMTTVDCRL